MSEIVWLAVAGGVCLALFAFNSRSGTAKSGGGGSDVESCSGDGGDGGGD